MAAERPIAYLDVDDTILRHPAEGDAVAAPGAADFLRFLAKHFEVRWLTRWCPGGKMRPDQLRQLERHLSMPAAELAPIRNPCRFVDEEPAGAFPVKWQALDWDAIDAGRPFVWIENYITPEDELVLAARGLYDRYIHCDVTAEPGRLAEVRRILEERFGLADG